MSRPCWACPASGCASSTSRPRSPPGPTPPPWPPCAPATRSRPATSCISAPWSRARICPPCCARSLGCPRRSRCYWPAPAADLPALYAGATAFVFPSLYEGFGLPPLEAMALGTPVVAARTSSLPEVLGDAALFVPPLDETAWTEALQQILDDAPLRAALRARGQAQAARYSWERT